MIDHGHLFRLNPAGFTHTRSDSYPIGQGCELTAVHGVSYTSFLNFLSFLQASPLHFDHPFITGETKMARWTESTADINHMVAISKHIPVGDIVRIVLKNGTVIEGVFRRMNIENNGGQGGWKFCGECEIETKDHSRFVLDYLDIKSASSLWNDPVSTEYYHLGLITLDHKTELR